MNIATTTAKPTQVPFVITRQKVIELIQSLPSDDDMLKVSKVANEIKRYETGKLPGNANAAINLIIKLVDDAKVEADQQ